ncbi:uncharacterized protein LOC134272589 [Saccostrea cucullata]|uniref:uncharacterized protein LOC134272589 n=1 Tax=Saccostrea cuccullata TaxID=36930 RepID=UPI002ED5D0F1
MFINAIAALFILLFAIDGLPTVSNMDGCGGHAYGCCEGFIWNTEKRECVKCQNGYSGVNCSEICDYPNYGEDCQNECHCTQDICDHRKGCQKKSQDIPGDEQLSENGNQTKSVTQPSKTWDKNKIISLGVLIIFFICIALIVGFFLVRVKKRCTKTDLDRMSGENRFESHYQEIPDRSVLRNDEDATKIQTIEEMTLRIPDPQFWKS